MESPAHGRDQLPTTDPERLDDPGSTTAPGPTQPLSRAFSFLRACQSVAGSGSWSWVNPFGNRMAGSGRLAVNDRDRDEGLVGLCQRQGRDPSCRIFPHFAEAASMVQLDMSQEIKDASDSFCKARMAGDMKWKGHARKLRKKLPAYYAFAQARMSIETLSNPGDSVFRDVKSYFQRIEEDGYRPPKDPRAWKSLRTIPRQEEWAKALPEGGPIGRFISSFFREEYDPASGMELYNIEGLILFVNILFTLVVGVFFCVPIVIMGLSFCSREVHVGLSVLFAVVSGLGLVWWQKDPLWSAALMVAYVAAMANVNFGGQ